ASISEEIENLFGSRDFEWITANPIKQIMPAAHSSRFVVVSPGSDVAHGLEFTHIREHGSHLSNAHHRYCQWQPQTFWQAVVGLLDRPPNHTPSPLVVINGDEQFATSPNQDARVLQGLPHIAGVMEHSPGIDDVELP